MAACTGSSSEASMVDNVGAGRLVEGTGGGGIDFEVEASASQAAFSASSLHFQSAKIGISLAYDVPFDLIFQLLQS